MAVNQVVAWVNINGNAGISSRIIDQFNVSSVADDEPTTAGKYTITFDNSIDADSICIASTYYGGLGTVFSDFAWVGIVTISADQATIIVTAPPETGDALPRPVYCRNVYVSFIGKS